MNRDRATKFTLTAVILGVSVLAGGCRKGDSDKASAKADKVLKITAPEKVRQMWNAWKGRYVIFVHRDNPIQQFSDFSGRNLLCALIETDAIVDEVQELCLAGEIKDTNITVQNNTFVYEQEVVGNPKAIAIMVPEVADHYKFRDNPKLIEVVIE
jgi:hypothetical protein